MVSQNKKNIWAKAGISFFGRFLNLTKKGLRKKKTSISFTINIIPVPEFLPFPGE